MSGVKKDCEYEIKGNTSVFLMCLILIAEVHSCDGDGISKE